VRTVDRVARALAALLLIGCVCATGALASHSPSRSERSQISSAVRHSSLTAGVPGYEYRITRIRISTRGPYASVLLIGVGSFKTTVQPVAGVLRRVRRGWRLLDVGGILNCADAPIRVFRDLHLTPCLAGNQTRF
jgi:hypothetical protein